MKQHVKHSMSLLSVVCYFSLALKLSGDFSLKPRPAVQCLMLCRCGLGPIGLPTFFTHQLNFTAELNSTMLKGRPSWRITFFPTRCSLIRLRLLVGPASQRLKRILLEVGSFFLTLDCVNTVFCLIKCK